MRAKAEKGEVLFGNIDAWVIWNLTGGPKGGVHVTDVSNASRTMLMNLETLDWDPDMLKVMGIPRAMLPAIRPSSGVYGNAVGALDGIPVAGDLGDQQAALFGQTCFSAGEAKNTYGTGCFMLLNTGTKPVQSKNGLLTTLGYKIGEEAAVYCLEGSIAITGALVQMAARQSEDDREIAGCRSAWRRPWRITVAFISSRHSPACSPPIGRAMPAAPLLA